MLTQFLLKLFPPGGSYHVRSVDPTVKPIQGSPVKWPKLSSTQFLQALKVGQWDHCNLWLAGPFHNHGLPSADYLAHYVTKVYSYLSC